jgi:hypothetical protein
MYEERQYLLPPNPYERSIVDEYPEVTIRVWPVMICLCLFESFYSLISS